jgi:hypothetical protein
MGESVVQAVVDYVNQCKERSNRKYPKLHTAAFGGGAREQTVLAQ